MRVRIAARSPVMQVSRCRPVRRLRLAFRQRPRASFGAMVFATADRQDRLLRSGDSAMVEGCQPLTRRDATRHDSPALRPAVARSSAKYPKVSRRPPAVSGTPLFAADQRHGVPCLARCISPLAALRSRRGTSDAGGSHARAGGSPDRRWIAPARPASRTTGFPRPVPHCCGDAELLRRARLAPDFRGVPRPCRTKRPQDGGHHTPVTSPALFLFW